MKIAVTRFLYILLLISAAISYPLYDDKLSYIILVTLIVLPFVMLAEALISGAFLRYSVKNRKQTVFRGDKGEFCIDIHNRGFLPLSCVRIRARTEFPMTGETHTVTAEIPVPPGDTRTISVNFSSAHCGCADIYIDCIIVSDVLRLFPIKKYRKGIHCGTVCIVPKISPEYTSEAEYLLSLPPAESMSESQEVITGRDGTPGEVCDYREFRPGDRVSLIHYKLSARFDKDIIKILSVMSSDKFLLSADFSPCFEGDVPDLDRLDEIIGRLMSCAFYLAAENVNVFVSVPHDSDCPCVPLESCNAAVYSDSSSFFTIAAAILSSKEIYDLSAPKENGFTCRVF